MELGTAMSLVNAMNSIMRQNAINFGPGNFDFFLANRAPIYEWSLSNTSSAV